MATKMQKILVSGDVDGKFSQLFQRVETVNKKAGPFDMLLCVGNFFASDDTEWKLCLNGTLKTPVATYILGPNTKELENFYPNTEVEELCPNIMYLGRKGVLTGPSKLKLMYLSGIEGRKSSSNHFTADDIKTLERLAEYENSLKGVDILITSQWPKGVSKYVMPPQRNVDENGSQLISQLARIVTPRYHFCGLENVHYERLPYRNHRILSESAKHVTRFLSLGKVGNSQKQKWLYAFSIASLSSMDASELVKQPVDVTENPYSLQIIPQNETLLVQETPVQYFYDMNPTNTGKRRHENQNFQSKRQKQWKPTQPTGPCWFCLGSPDVEKHLVVSIGNDIYLTLPKGGLVSDHILICPIAHFAATVDLPPEALAEVNKFKNALRKFYDSQQKIPIFFERNFRTQHFQIQVVPVSRKLENKIFAAFKRCAEQNELKLQTMPDSTELDIPSGVAYFYAEIPSGERLLHLINKRFPLQFGREVVASPDLLDIPDKVDWKKCPNEFAQEKQIAEEFKNNFKPFDFTNERAFQKQPTIFLNRKKTLAKKKKSLRYVRNVGLGFKTPREAIEGTYIDKKCPFTGDISIRGRILTGIVQKMKMQRTIVIRRDYLHYVKKYNRFEKRHKNMSVHLSPCFRDVKIGDVVTVGECRPLSKTVRFNVLKVTKGPGSKKQFQKF
uniref:Small ribosomal subunit protein uS17 n=1 Tax=Strigamia maritima TaxID=126957 RepID=T1JGW9_STRMM